MSDSAEPDWDALPYDPERFFELPEPFERIDLKRRYNALIRQFKPEKHPAEFQRIRAAFEEVDNRLRYGESFRTRLSPRNEPTFDWTPPPTAKPATESTSDAEMPQPNAADEQGTPASNSSTSPPHEVSKRPLSPPRPQSALEVLQDRLRSESPQDIYQQLEAEPHKTPFDFYVLAVLSDVVKPGLPLVFLQWITRGLQRYPREPGLLRLLSTLLRSELPSELLPEIVLAVAEAVPDDRFYALTETLWDRLLGTHPFLQGAQCLATCELQLRDHRIDGKLTFYVHYLRRAVWKAEDFWHVDREWLEAAFRLLEDNANDLLGRLESDFEFLQFLQKYRSERSNFLNGTTARDLIDSAMRDYCLQDGYDADRAVLECQLALATNPEWLRSAFSTTNEEFPAWWTLWNWISADVSDRLGVDSTDPDSNLLWQQLRQVLRRCEHVVERSSLGTRWRGLRWFYWRKFCIKLAGDFWDILDPIVVLLLCVVCFIHWIGQPERRHQLVAWIVGISAILALILAWFVDRKAIAQQCHDQEEKLAWLSYQQFWRPLMEQHLSLSHHPYRLFIEQLAVEHEDIKCKYTAAIHAHASKDYALGCLALALRFLR